ncbi:MAG: DNA gyrase/topoisomerase IV subunit A, partial [Cytophagales bacterium]|nr:DNA gyrase/topoisomerase IV subunit A [Cytophagales bacterium]
PDITIDALYAFTDCEVSISPNACVIVGEKPHFLTVNEILRTSTFNTKELLRRELEIRKAELLEKLLYASLEKIFIENRIYRKIEECETWDDVIATIDKGLKPFSKQFYREITTEDIVRLTEIKIKRISRYDGFKADELMKRLQEELTETEDNLANLTRYAISYFKDLLKKYGKGRERKTEIRSFNTIAASQVAAANQKLFLNRKDGFIGYGLKKDDNTEQIGECSDIDDVIVFRRDGKCVVTKIQDKVFVGKDIIHASVFKKNDERMVYNMAYLDGKSGICYVKRFQITAVTRDREYELAGKNPGSKVLYFSANPNAEAETVTVGLTPGSKAKAKVYDFDFADIDVKGREAIGNILTKYPVKKVTFKSAGTSTMGGLDIWYDENLGRLNTDKRGRYLGNFEGEDRILVVYHTGEYELTNYEFTNRYEPKDIAVIEKFNPERVISVVHYDGAAGQFYAKRFKIERTTVDKKFSFIGETKGSRMVVVTTSQQPQIEITTKKGREEETTTYDLDLIAEVRGWKAMGHKLPGDKINRVKLLASRSDADVEWKMNGNKGKDKEEKEEEVEEKVGQLGMF